MQRSELLHAPDSAQTPLVLFLLDAPAPRATRRTSTA